MNKHSDDEIRSLSRVSCKIAGEYLGISSMTVSYGLRQEKLPIGYAVLKEDRYSESWGYHIVPERLIAYKHGTINSLQVDTIEKNLSLMIDLFAEIKTDLMSLLKEKKE